MVLASKVAIRRTKITLAVLGVITGVLVLAQRIKELYETTQQNYDDSSAGHP
jgi:hypothetical protein